MTFKQYLEALSSGDIEKWIIENMTSGNKFSKYKAASIIKQALSSGYCPVERFRIYRNPDDMVFGQFIALETKITSNDDVTNKLLHFAQYILRPIYDEEFDNEDIDKEQQHVDNILNEPCENILRVVNKYMEQRNEYIHNKYNGVFYKAKDDDEDETEEQNDNVDNLDGQWYWYSLIRTLSGNLHKHNETLMLKMDVVAPEIAYIRYMEQKEEQERKLQEIKNRVKNGTH
jgi:hypothetical protein